MKRRRIITLVIALILITGIGAVIRQAIRTPEETVIAFCDEINAGKYKRALRYIDPLEAKAIRTGMKLLGDKKIITAFEVVMPFVTKSIGLEISPEVMETTTDEKNAVVTIGIEQIGGYGYYDIHLKREYFRWCIQYVWISAYEEEPS